MAQQWFYTKDGKSKIGPFSSADLQKLARAGLILPTDMVWKEGMRQWTSARKIKGLFSNLKSTPKALSGIPPPPPRGAATPPSLPVGFPSTVPAADQEVVETVEVGESGEEEQVVEVLVSDENDDCDDRSRSRLRLGLIAGGAVLGIGLVVALIVLIGGGAGDSKPNGGGDNKSNSGGDWGSPIRVDHSDTKFLVGLKDAWWTLQSGEFWVHPFVVTAAQKALAKINRTGTPTTNPTPPKRPEPIALFNGKDLTGFYTFLKESGRNIDPKKVFSVLRDPKDMEKLVLRISGEEPGYLATVSSHKHYRLMVEYKWGEKTFAPRKDKSRRSAITIRNQVTSAGTDAFLDNMFHAYGYEVLLGEGGQTGDISFPRGGPIELRLTVDLAPPEPNEKSPLQVYTRGQPAREVGPSVIHPLNYSPEFKDEKGFVGPKDIENKPPGEWNTLEIVSHMGDNNIQVFLNKDVVNFGAKPTNAGGKILFHSRGAEIFFRKIELLPLVPSPKKNP